MKLKTLLTASAATLLCSSVASAGTLDDVKAKGYIDCGVTTGLGAVLNTAKV